MEGIARIGPAVGHAVAGWAACAGVMGVGRAVTTIERTLLIHAAAVPVVFGALAWSYSRRAGHRVRGTWLPFGLILVVTWIVGRRTGGRAGS